MARTIRLGIFIVATLTILAAGVFLIGDRQLLFSSTYRLTADFKNVSGLNGGAEVRVGGIHKGTVKGIQLPTAPGGAMTVMMTMDKTTRKVIRQDSVAAIETEGLLGSKFVEISFGSDNSPEVHDGSSIQGMTALDISDLMKKTDVILDTTRETLDNIRDSSVEFRDIATKVNSGQGSVGALVNDRKLYEDLHQATAEAKLGATAFQENMEALKHNFFLRGFFKDRGYSDLAKLTENEIQQLPSAPMMKTFNFDPKKLFDNGNTAKLKNSSILDEAGHFLENNGFGAAVIVVSGGMKGDTDTMRQLTEARAMVIRDQLVKNFRMNDTHLKTMGAGKSAQAPNDGLVEIFVYAPGVSVPDEVAKKTN